MKKRFKKIFNRLVSKESGNNSSPTALLSPEESWPVQKQLITSGEPVIFDVGAHIGKVTKIYRNCFDNAFIYSFEPFPESFEELSKSAKDDKRTYCFQKALSDREGIAVLNSNLSSATNSLLTTDERSSAFWKEGLLDTTSTVEVQTTTIDAFCVESRISNIDILKMDVQGSEYSVLNGAKEMLEAQKISLIYTELIMCPTYKGQNKLHEYLSLLASFGYEFYDFYNPIRRNNRLNQADAIFLSTSFLEEVATYH